jgi:hypothetical protein
MPSPTSIPLPEAHAHGHGGLDTIRAGLGRTLEAVITLTADGKPGELTFTQHAIGYAGGPLGSQEAKFTLESGCVYIMDLVADGTQRVSPVGTVSCCG